MADENMNMELDWDSGIEANVGEEKNENWIPPVGEYGFTIIEFEKTFSKAGRKMAKLTLELDDDAHNWKVTDYIVLTQAWKCAQFFECLGLKQKGVALERMPWDKVENELGSIGGRVQIMHDPYNGKNYCKVDRYVLAKDIEGDSDGVLPFEF